MDPQVSRKPYIREIPGWRWVFDHPRYIRYMARELSCLFIGGYSLMLVMGLVRLSQGRAAFDAFLAALAHPVSILFHVMALVFAVYHSITWFNLTPKALPVQIGEEFVSGRWIAGAHYALWGLVTLAVLAAAGVF